MKKIDRKLWVDALFECVDGHFQSASADTAMNIVLTCNQPDSRHDIRDRFELVHQKKRRYFVLDFLRSAVSVFHLAISRTETLASSLNVVGVALGSIIASGGVAFAASGTLTPTVNLSLFVFGIVVLLSSGVFGYLFRRSAGLRRIQIQGCTEIVRDLESGLLSKTGDHVSD